MREAERDRKRQRDRDRERLMIMAFQAKLFGYGFMLGWMKCMKSSKIC